ncbi:MAG: DUF2304 domain-containing protein [Clostridia bacterium]|nr:DUF2304 domain-containing protein [Clostridia bacterium]
MNIALRISLLFGIIIYVAVIFSFLRKQKISLKYSLLWFFSAVVLLIMDLFPNQVSKIAHFIGVEYSVNAVFLIFIFIMLLILISLTAIVSKQHNQIKVLTQKLAILSHKIDKKSEEEKKYEIYIFRAAY